MKKVFNFNEDMEILANGDYSEYSERMLTNVNTCLENLREKSSVKYKKIDIRQKFNLTSVKEMLDEWTFECSDKYGISNIHNIKYGKDNEKFECQLCKSHNINARGNYKCDYVYKITNNKTNESLWVGSQCIKKFNITVMNNGYKVKNEELPELFKEIEITTKKFQKDNSCEIFDFCYENGYRLLNSIYNLSLKSQSVIIANKRKKILDKYIKEMSSYKSVIYTLFNNRNNPDFTDSITEEEVKSKQAKLYELCRELCNKGYYTFCPNKELTIDHTCKKSAFFIMITSYISSIMYENKWNGIKNVLTGIDYKYLFDLFDRFTLTDSFNGVKYEMINYMNSDFNKTKEPLIAHIIALTIILSDSDEEEIKFSLKKFSKENRERIYNKINIYLQRDYFAIQIKENIISLMDIINEINNPENKKKKIEKVRNRKMSRFSIS